jgi:hypothetical protein
MARHAQFTTEAFREILENATEELVDNNGTLEIKSLQAWTTELRNRITHAAERLESHEIDRNPLTSAGLQ